MTFKRKLQRKPSQPQWLGEDRLETFAHIILNLLFFECVATLEDRKSELVTRNMFSLEFRRSQFCQNLKKHLLTGIFFSMTASERKESRRCPVPGWERWEEHQEQGMFLPHNLHLRHSWLRSRMRVAMELMLTWCRTPSSRSAPATSASVRMSSPSAT
jgi:hypothetical protein